jgi:proline iminopeptidase
MPSPASDEEFAGELKASLPLYWADPARIEPYADDFSARLPSAHAAAASYASNRYPFDLRDGLGSVKAPTLIVVGVDDFVCPPEAATVLHQGLSHSKLLLIEDCGHFTWMEQPAVFEKRVPAFLHALGLAG